jgi:hypothetical protein
MESMAALRSAFSLSSTEKLGTRFTPDQLKRIKTAMQNYASCKCREQREISQRAFDTAYNDDKDLGGEGLYELSANKGLEDDVDEPEYD